MSGIKKTNGFVDLRERERRRKREREWRRGRERRTFRKYKRENGFEAK